MSEALFARLLPGYELPAGVFAADPGPWCERDEGPEAMLRESSNALSDLCFLGVALFMARCAWVDRGVTWPRGSLAATPGREAISAVVNLIHFCGTFWNHSCRCHGGHVLDVFGMFSVLSFLSLHKWFQVLERASGLGAPTWLFAVVQVVVCGLLWPLCHLRYDDAECEHRELFGFIGSLLPALVADAAFKPASYGPGAKYFFGALALLVLSLACQSIEQPRHGHADTFCDPDSPFQLHAVWHVGTAVAAVVVFQAQRLASYDLKRA